MEFSVLTSLQLWTPACWRELGSLPGDTSREKSCCIHRQWGPAVQAPQGTLLRRVFLFHPVLYLTATHLGFSMDSRVCWEVPEWIPPRKGSPARSCLGSTQLTAHSAGWQPASGALSVLSPGHFHHTASPKTGTGLSQRQWIRINFRLKPRARDDFLLLQNRHSLPPASSLFQALTGSGLFHLFLNPVFCCENTKSETCCLLIK